MQNRSLHKIVAKQKGTSKKQLSGERTPYSMGLVVISKLLPLANIFRVCRILNLRDQDCIFNDLNMIFQIHLACLAAENRKEI